MITGTVVGGREAVITLTLSGTNGIEAHIDVVIDTGFTDSLTLSTEWVDALALPYLQAEIVLLADGSEINVDQYEGTVIWDGSHRPIVVHCMEGNPLIGMSMLQECRVTLHVRDGGAVEIEALL
jgi:clan AA aspartic protease